MEERIAYLFWPDHILDTTKLRSGYVIGWNCHGFTACAAAIIQVLEAEMNQLAATRDPKYMFMNSVCGAPPVIIGTVIVDSKDIQLPHPLKTPIEAEIDSEYTDEAYHLNQKKASADLWMTITLSKGSLPVVESIYCCGYKYKTNSAQIFLYTQPNPYLLQSLSLKEFSLTDSDGMAISVESSRNLAKHLINRHTYDAAGVDVQLVLNQINTSYELQKHIIERFPKRDRNPRPLREFDRTYAYYSMYVINAFMFVYSALRKFYKKILVHPLLYLLLLLRIVAECLLYILNFPLLNTKIQLKNVFFTAQQLDLRLNQIVSWPYQYSIYNKRDFRSTAHTRKHYIQLYNSIWLVANDIMLGIWFGGIIFDFLPQITEVFKDYILRYGVQSFETTIIWLMGWPAGLKLNPNLDAFLGEMFLSLFKIWTWSVSGLLNQFSTILYVLAYSGTFGFSFILSTVADIFKLLTLHIIVFYIVAAKIYLWQLNIILSLFYLFQGKRWNVLRNRMDSNDYQMDQLLLGTILFTLVSFLFPTTVVYYILFAKSRISIMVVEALLEIGLALCNHFPLFALIIRVKDPDRLSGGIRTSLVDTRQYRDLANRSDVSYLTFKNIPLSYASIFEKYFKLVEMFQTHYFNIRMVKSLLFGHIIKPIDRIQLLPELPATRTSILNFWLFMKVSNSAALESPTKE